MLPYVPRAAIALLALLCAAALPAVEPLTLYHAINAPVQKPTCAAFEPGDDSRLYVLEKDTGDIWLHQNGNRVGRFLHLDVANAGEQGMLAIAFDPDYASNGFFYVFYSAPGGTSLLDRYRRDPGDANRADLSSRLEVLRIPRGDGDVHYGGWLGFTPATQVTASPDNKHWLYITAGDASDAGNAQRLDTRCGKILRIDVDPARFGTQAQPYGIPSDNPWRAQAAPRNEFIAIGVRNPWRAGFDRATGDLWLCDVGAVSHEEVDRIPYARLSGAATTVLNLGWPAWEGDVRDANQAMSPEVPDHFGPIRSFGPGAFIGGRVYRGSAMPGWVGSYIWSNFGTPMYAMMGGDPAQLRSDLKSEIEGNLGQGVGQITSFAEDNAGELYAVVFDQGGFGGGAVMRYAPYDPNKRPARFTSQPELYATVGFPYTYNVVVDGLPSVSLTAPTLPAGMSGPTVTTNTPPTLRASLSWTPTATGTFPVRLRAESTGIGPAAWQEFTLTVQGPRLADLPSGSAAVRGGLDWAAFNDDPADGWWDAVPAFPALTPVQRGSLATIAIPAGIAEDHVAVRYSGYIRVDSEGVYRFKATADDRVRVSVGGRLVYDYDSPAARANPVEYGSIALQPGYHRIEIGFLEQAGGQSISVQWQPVGAAGFSTIPAANLFRPAVGSEYGLEGAAGVQPYLGTFPATAASAPPAKLSQTGAFANLATLTPAPGVIAYDVASPLWSDDAAKARWMAVPAGGTIGFSERDNWAFPAGTVFIKHFGIDTPTGLKRLETRFLIMNGTGAYGVTYKWNEAGTDADLDPGVEASSLELTRADGRRQRWNFPSRTNCMECHTPAANYALGLRTAQLNCSFAFTTADGLTRSDNQLRAYGAAGLLSQPYAEQNVAAYDRLVKVDDASADLTHRVRSYLEANCASCHRPGAVSNVALDARFRATETMSGILDQPASLAVGSATGLKLIASNHPEQSAIYLRMNTTDPLHRMPKLGRELIHPQAVGTLYEYIMTRNGQSAGPRPPVVNAGTDRAITVGRATPLVAQVVNESGQALSLAWTANPAAGVTIANAASATPTVTVAAAGTYTLTLTASAGGQSASDAIVLQAVGNTAPTVSLPATASAFTGVPLGLRPTASDADGLPDGILTYQWSVVSGPGAATFAPAATARDADVSFAVGGSYVLRLTVSDGMAAASADIAVSVDAIIAAIDCGNAAGTPVVAGGVTWAFDPLQGAGTQRVEAPGNGDFAGTDVYDAVLRTNRTGNASYAFSDLDPAGSYRVRVLTTEVYFTQAGSRRFDVYANDVRVLQNVDPYALGGAKFAYGEALSQTFAPAASGALTVRFQSVADAALVCALRLEKIGGGTQPANQPPTAAATASPATITLPTSTVNLSGSGVDPEGRPLNYAWSQVSGPAAVTLASPAAASTTATFSAAGSYVLRLTVTDDKPQSATADVAVTVQPAPSGGWSVVRAIDSGRFTGPALSADGIAWELDTTIAGDRFEGPADVAGTTTLDAVYQSNRTAPDFAYVFAGLDPAATYRMRVLTTEVWFQQAGSRIFDVRANGTVVASGVDPFALSGAAFSAGTLTTATFTPDASGTVELRCTATADQALVSGLVLERQGTQPANLPPTATAAASPATITLPTSSVALNGAGSDPEGRALTYAWSVVSGGTATFANAASAATTASFAAAGTYVLRLTVTDDKPQSASADVTITVLPAPSADWTVVRAIDSGRATGTPITAEGITWELDATMAANRTEGPADVAGTTTLDAVYQTNRTGGDFTYLLNGLDPAATYRLRILTTEVWFNQAGSRVFDARANGTVVAAGIDPYAVSGGKYAAGTVTSAGFQPDAAGAVALRFVASKDQALVAALVLERQGGEAPPNQAPSASASASPASITLPISSVALSGAGSDPEGRALTYAWSVVSGGTATFANAAAAATTASFTAAGTYVLRLTVTDDKPQSASADLTVTVLPAPVQASSIRISFQPASAAVPSGWLADTGATYAVRNGQTYGWDADVSADTRKRNVNPDPVLDTFVHVAKAAPRTWRIALANGWYDIEIDAGDPSYKDSTNSFAVEGQIVSDPTPQSSNYDVHILRVQVLDGVLDIGQAAAGANAKLQAVQITAVPSGGG